MKTFFFLCLLTLLAGVLTQPAGPASQPTQPVPDASNVPPRGQPLGPTPSQLQPGQVSALRFEFAVYVVPANAQKLDIRVLHLGNSTSMTTVNYATSDGTAIAGQDYVAKSGVLAWASGDKNPQIISIPILSKTTGPFDKTFSVSLFSNTNSVLMFPSITFVTITSPTTPTQPSTSASTSSGASPMQPQPQPLQPQPLASPSGAAGALSPSTQPQLPILFPPEASQTSGVQPGASTAQPSAPFIPSIPTTPLSAPTAPMPQGPADSVIQWDAPAYATDEGKGTVVVGVRRLPFSNNPQQPLSPASVQYATVEGTATSPKYFTATSGTLIWGPNDRDSKLLAIPIALNPENRLSQTQFKLKLSNPSGGASLGQNSEVPVLINAIPFGQGIIAFDREMYNVNPKATNNQARLVVTRSRGTQGPVTIGYATNDGTAVAEKDYVGALGTLQWGDGDGSPRVISIGLLDNPTPAPPFGRNFGVRLFMNPGTSSGFLGQPRIAIVNMGEFPESLNSSVPVGNISIPIAGGGETGITFGSTLNSTLATNTTSSSKNLTETGIPLSPKPSEGKSEMQPVPVKPESPKPPQTTPPPETQNLSGAPNTATLSIALITFVSLLAYII